MMQSKLYVLRGREVVAEPDFMAWARWFERSDQTVARDALPGGVQVSTVFLGADHRFFGDGPPVVFETMVFGGSHDGFQIRYATWAQAALGHVTILKALSADNGDEGPDELDAFLARKAAV